jgi:GTPase SAR1 family protein
MSIPVICIIGESGSGKTTLLEKLIPELKSRGHRVATVKHHSHAGFDIDHPGKDSYRHAQAGKPSIEIIRGDLGIRPIDTTGPIFAIASNVALHASVPVFDLNDARGMADAIESGFLK